MQYHGFKAAFRPFGNLIAPIVFLFFLTTHSHAMVGDGVVVEILEKDVTGARPEPHKCVGSVGGPAEVLRFCGFAAIADVLKTKAVLPTK